MLSEWDRGVEKEVDPIDEGGRGWPSPPTDEGSLDIFDYLAIIEARKARRATFVLSVGFRGAEYVHGALRRSGGLSRDHRCARCGCEHDTGEAFCLDCRCPDFGYQRERRKKKRYRDYKAERANETEEQRKARLAKDVMRARERREREKEKTNGNVNDSGVRQEAESVGSDK